LLVDQGSLIFSHNREGVAVDNVVFIFLPRDALAEHGLAIAWRLSVTLVDCDHIGGILPK